MRVQIKRIYEASAETDGYRVYVDRLWARGVRKEDAHLDLWLKDIAPSNELRKWFAHDPEKWEVFKTRYKAELDANTDAVQQLLALIETHDTVTLIYSARDEAYNQAVALRDYLLTQLASNQDAQDL